MKITRTKLPELGYQEVHITEATVAQNIQATKIAGSNQGLKFVCALLSLTATFDGKKLLMEDIENMPESFFLALVSAGIELPTLEKE